MEEILCYFKTDGDRTVIVESKLHGLIAAATQWQNDKCNRIFFEDNIY